MVVYSGEFGTWEDVPLHLGVPVLVGAVMLVAIALWDRATSSLKPLQCSQVKLLLLLCGLFNAHFLLTSHSVCVRTAPGCTARP